MVRQLSDLGMGRRDTMEDVIGEEAELIAQQFAEKKEEPISIKVILKNCAGTVLLLDVLFQYVGKQNCCFVYRVYFCQPSTA